MQTTHASAYSRAIAICAVVGITLSGCGVVQTSSNGSASISADASAPAATDPATTSAPIINNAPASTVVAGATYDYIPNVTAASGSTLTFDITNLPAWATFDATTGELRGTPTASNVGSSAEIEIGASDGTNRGTVGPFRITVSAAPSAPVSNPTAPPVPTIAGSPAASVVAGQLYIFTASSSNPAGGTLSFSIVNRPSWATFNTATGVLSGTPLTANVGTFGNILISVSDGNASSALPAFSIQVRPATSSAPTIAGSPAVSVVAGTAYSFIPTAGDPGGDHLTFAIQNLPGWASFNTATGQLAGTPSTASVGTFANIVISVSDGTTSTALPAFSIQVQAAPSAAPTISGDPATSVAAGAPYSFKPVASDPAGSSVSFTIQNAPSWATFNTSTGQLSGTASAGNVGSFNGIVISASAAGLSSSLPAFSIQVTAAADRAPTISGNPTTAATVGTGYSFTPTASDPDGNALTFSIQNQPSWASFNAASGQLSGTPQTQNIGTFANVVISASDGTLKASLAPFSIQVSASAEQAPTIGGAPPSTATAGATYSFQPTASDANANAKLSFSIQNLPAWANFDTANGTLSGTPAASNVATYSNIVIAVSDGTLSASLPAFAIQVKAQPDQAPTISGSPATTVTAGTSYSFTPSASDPDDNATLTFSVQNAPSWANLNPATGNLTGTPGAKDVGTDADIIISVSDGQLSTSLPTFSINVQAAAAQGPKISGTPPATATVGSGYSFVPTASDATANAKLTFSVQNLPSWASFNTGNGTLSGTPASQNVATYSNILVSVSDGSQSASLAAFSITVRAAAIPTLTISGSPATADIAVNKYSFTPTATDSNANAQLVFSVQNLPSWARFDTANGTLSGTPALNDVGNFGNITISVTDGQANAQLAPFTITVTDPADAGLTISGTPTASLVAGNAYSFVPKAVDPAGRQLTFSVQNLPGWASFNTQNGALTGSPGAADVGSYAGIVISVSDGILSASLPAFTVTVTQMANGSATLNWTPPTQNTDGSPLTNLAGFTISYGTSAGNLSHQIQINNPGLTTYVIDDLSPATWYFAITAYSSTGAVSSFSNGASKTIN